MQDDISEQIRDLKNALSEFSSKIKTLEGIVNANVIFQVSFMFSLTEICGNTYSFAKSYEYRGYLKFPLEKIPHVVISDDEISISKTSLEDLISNQVVDIVLSREGFEISRETLMRSLILKSYVVSGGTDSISRKVSFVN
jgi:hypothetical protein